MEWLVDSICFKIDHNFFGGHVPFQNLPQSRVETAMSEKHRDKATSVSVRTGNLFGSPASRMPRGSSRLSDRRLSGYSIVLVRKNQQLVHGFG